MRIVNMKVKQTDAVIPKDLNATEAIRSNPASLG